MLIIITHINIMLISREHLLKIRIIINIIIHILNINSQKYYIINYNL